MKTTALDDIKINKLGVMPTEGGEVMHFIKIFDSGFKDFGEVYFSWIKKNRIKAWKKHNRMTLNLVVPFGTVRFVFHIPNNKKLFRVEEIGNSNYNRITVPPGIWFGFKGIGKKNNLVSNFADIVHDPNEVEKVKKEKFLYNW